jgi:hypothetical protein
MDKKFIDRYGNSLKKGDTVKLIDIPLELFLGRTETEQNILRAEVGNNHLIQSADDIPHTILISTSCVTRILG